MKRMHIHLSVPRLEAGIEFYSTLFGREPDKVKQDYAKWQLDDPRVNFAISTRSESIGLDHLGIQMETDVEVNATRQRLSSAGADTGDINSGVCCYAESTKFWTLDPAGIPWENFVTMQDAEVYGNDTLKEQQGACCETKGTAETASCC